MPFLRINGIDVNVANDSAEFTPEIFGEEGRAPDASLWVQRTATKRLFRFATPPVLADEMIALVGLINGEGHVWPVSSAQGLYSSRGALLTSSGAAVVRDAAVGKFGTDSARVTTGTTMRTGVFYPTGTGYPEPTISFWYSDGGAFVHRAYRAAAGQWYAAGTPSSAPSGITISYSATYGWQLANSLGSNLWFDDLWICPFDWPATWPGLVAAYNNPVGLCPRVKADGDAIGNGLVPLVPNWIGRVNRATPGQGYLSGAFRSNLHAVEFSLSEV